LKTENFELGFTILELLLVLALLGILITVAIPRLVGINEKALQTEASNFLTTVKRGLEIYYTQNNAYPFDGVDLTIDINLGKYIENFDEVNDDWDITYEFIDENNFTVVMSNKTGVVGDVVLSKSSNGYKITAN